MSKLLHHIYRIIHFSSIDVSICSALLAWPLAKEFCPQSTWVIILAISVQIIYFTDHILDTFRRKTKILSPRHQFVKDYLKTIFTTIILLVLINIYLCAQFLNISTILAGVGLCGMVGLYFLNSTILKIIPKEILTAIIYATGICLVPIYYNLHSPLLCPIIFIFVSILMCTLMNLMCNNLFEWDEDIQNKEFSLSIKVGKKNIPKFLYSIIFLLLFTFAFSMCKLNFFSSLYLFSILLIAIVHVIVYRNIDNPILIKHRRSLLEWSFAIPFLVYVLY
ncbi:MAG: hypothetical protein NTU43_05390 [Bacteroidetes bacterium]|nr:hypothetical protein [Bacteroidota bacterium]